MNHKRSWTWGKSSLVVELGGFCDFSLPPFTNHPHRHPHHHELCWVLSRRGRFHHGEESFDLQEGSVSVSDLDITHEISSHSHHNLSLFYISFQLLGEVPSLDTPSQLLRSFQLQHRQVASCSSTYPGLISASAPPADTVEKWRWDCSLLDFLIKGLSLLVAPPQEPTPVQSPVQKSLDLIREGCGDPELQLDHVAKTVGCSLRNLRRLFRRDLGASSISMLRMERCQRAKAWLDMGFTAERAALESGFSSGARFNRVFRETQGLTPGQYQRQHLKRTEPESPES